MTDVTLKKWFNSGEPMIWLNAAAVSVSLIIVVGLLLLIAIRGLGHFWPASVMQVTYTSPDNSNEVILLGEVHEVEQVGVERLKELGIAIDTKEEWVDRSLIKTGNRDIYGSDFKWVYNHFFKDGSYPETAITLERREWGNFYGLVTAIKENGSQVAEGENAWTELSARLDRTHDLHDEIRDIEKGEIGEINYKIERLRLQERKLQLNEVTNNASYKEIEDERQILQAKYEELQKKLEELHQDIKRDELVVSTIDGRSVSIPLENIVRAYRANAMNVFQKLILYFQRLWEFVSDEPREANTEGGIFPAIFGTVMMVIIMSMLVTPFGVVAAVYLREYAKQGALTRIIRIAVNNLAGVPSIVYGVFGLGFFVYFLGGSIDRLFYPEAAPAPVFGTPGILWSSLTLALLTVPVVIVATEEGLSRIPRAIREGSLALGATKAETLWRTVIPMATPAMMTGLILAVARAAGEVAPLMLVGVVKLAPSLPLDANMPFLHLDRKFMHLGFHIYDVGFQSPNVEAARPLVYATALLLVVIIIALNLAAIYIRNRLREKYKAMDS